MKRRRGTDEIQIVGIPYVDMLTIMVGCLIMLVAYLMITANAEAVRPIRIITKSVPILYTEENVEFSFSVVGGLEAYEWRWEPASKTINPCPADALREIPRGLTLDKDGRLFGILSRPSQPEPYPKKYCVQVVVNATGTNAELENKLKSLEREFSNDHARVAKEKDGYQRSTSIYLLEVHAPRRSAPPQSFATRLPGAYINQNYAYELTPIHAPERLKITSHEFIDTNGQPASYKPPTIKDWTIGWRPTAKGTLTIIIAGENVWYPAESNPFRQRYEIKVTDKLTPVEPLEIPDARLASARQLEQYIWLLQATGGTRPYQWSSEGLPDGLLLDSSSGEIGGKVLLTVAPGEKKVTFSVKDSQGKAAKRDSLLMVAPRAGDIERLMITREQKYWDKSTFPVGKFDYWDISISGGIGPFAWSYQFNVADSGLEGRENKIQGTATRPGRFPVTVTVTDRDGDRDTKSFELVAVLPPPPPPLVSEPPVNRPAGIAPSCTPSSEICILPRAVRFIRYVQPLGLPGTTSVDTKDLPDTFRLELNAENKYVIVATPTEVGDYKFSFTDATQENRKRWFHISVVDFNVLEAIKNWIAHLLYSLLP